MTKLQQAIENINLDEECRVGGEYGVHDGFFNALTVIDGVDYYFQGCVNDSGFDANDCGHDWGICEEVNEPLARKLAEDCDNDISQGFDAVKTILSEAFERFEA